MGESTPLKLRTPDKQREIELPLTYQYEPATYRSGGHLSEVKLGDFEENYQPDG
jgi:hypothetical protein